MLKLLRKWITLIAVFVTLLVCFLGILLFLDILNSNKKDNLENAGPKILEVITKKIEDLEIIVPRKF
jgi:hypothetical protein